MLKINMTSFNHLIKIDLLNQIQANVNERFKTRRFGVIHPDATVKRNDERDCRRKLGMKNLHTK